MERFDGIFDTIYSGLQKTCPKLDGIEYKLRTELQRVSRTAIPITYIHERLRKIAKYQDKLEVLRTSPGIEQRTPEWYAMRDTMITASDLAQAVGKGKFGTQNQFLIKKSGYEDVPFDPTIPPLKWGTMYEHVSNAIYEDVTGTKVYEFGLLPHPHLSWFGCSPDGITENGVMVEIKTPYRRLIKPGEVLEQYEYQIQGQLDVCELDECDFIEVELKEYEDMKSYETDEDTALYKGIVLERQLPDKNYEYRYSPLGLSPEEAINWAEKEGETFDYEKMHFWYMQRFHIHRVYRNPELIAQVLGEAKIVWDRVLQYRNSAEDYEAADLKAKKRTVNTSKRQREQFPMDMGLDTYAFDD
jgi:putative phage-type endonuclease